MRKKISQRTARQAISQLSDLKAIQKQQLNRWSVAYPGGVHIATEVTTAINVAKLGTAMLLGHTVVCKLDGGHVMYYAVKP